MKGEKMKVFRNPTFYSVVAAVCSVLILVSLFMIAGNLQPAPADEYFESSTRSIAGAGVTNLTNLELSGTLDVAGASTLTGATTITGNTDIAGTLQYGADDLYALGFATSGQQVVYGTASITGTLAAPHGLTTVTFCTAVMGEDPTAGAGDAAHVTVAVSANVCTLKAWQDDFVTAATEADVAVQWIVIGTP
jgi:hypothetical protein